MTYAETYEKLQEARESGVEEVTVELDEGTFTFPIDEALDVFDDLAPGEAFVIIEEQK